ncbi:MAG: tRNA (adenosine(37)-N6)-threonylcarbamoyltransferase complex ATPase subunit type 1 TsaE [Steroidobacteraceae bacterium]
MSEPIALANAEATRAYGRTLAAALRAHAQHRVLIGLSGELGAGKTTFVAGVLDASGVVGSIRSPTYTLVEPYELTNPPRTLYHLDLYRLRSAMELEDLGVRELLSGNTVLIVEWIENAPALTAVTDLRLEFHYQPNGRILRVDAQTPVGEALGATLRQRGVTVHRS